MNLFFTRLIDTRYAQAVRRGLVTIIPILLVGSFALVLKAFPIDEYQEFINGWCNGIIYSFMNWIYDATFGILAIYITCVTGYHYGILAEELPQNTRYGTLIVSLGCFVILSGFTKFPAEVMGTKGMFIAIIASCFGSEIFVQIAKRMKPIRLYSDGADIRLGNAIKTIFPVGVTFAVFAAVNQLVLTISGKNSFYEMLSEVVISFFVSAGDGILRGIIYVLGVGILWFFGIHGSDMLENVALQIFTPNSQINETLAAAGLAPTEILTKSFFDVFVLMGGCGTTIGLVIALTLFSKRSGTKNLAKLSILPLVFNVNEILIFGLPVVLNPTFLIPFLLAPMACYFTTYFSMWTGLVPLITSPVEWITPVFFSGYVATGSFSGVVLQAVNILLVVLIYLPFVKKYDEIKLKNAKRDYNSLVEIMKKSETDKTEISITDLNTVYGWLAKALAFDLEKAYRKNEVQLYYQPQYSINGDCIGAEALVRWKHPVLDYIYPPLIFKLAHESGFLEELEEYIVRSAFNAAHVLYEKTGKSGVKISVNITGVTMQTKQFEDFLEKLHNENVVDSDVICIELTEQAAIHFDDTVTERFKHLRDMGYHLAIDDFSMGSTSLQYLLGGHFDEVKLDGGLVKEIMNNQRCRDIISSIVQLSENLKFDVLAEYVETAELRDELAKVGCVRYQGWYYAKAMPFEEYMEMIMKEGRVKNKVDFWAHLYKGSKNP